MTDPREYEPRFGSHGAYLQSGIPKTEVTRRLGVGRAGGLMLEGVVVNVYYYDDAEGGPIRDDTDRSKNALYCDVWCYGNRYKGVVPNVKITSTRGGMHEDQIEIPRPCTVDVSDPSGGWEVGPGTNPANLDGDHVLIGFIDDDLSKPCIVRGVPHPGGDVGNNGDPIGNRVRLERADKQPSLRKHRGGFFGVDTDGNFVVDLQLAHKGAYGADGKEPDPPEDGATGNYTIKLPTAGKVTVEIGGGESLTLDLSDGAATLKLGDGLKSAVIAETLQAWWDATVKPQLDLFGAHIHATTATVATGGAVGVIGPPVPLLIAPPFNAAAISSKAKFPDG